MRLQTWMPRSRAGQHHLRVKRGDPPRITAVRHDLPLAVFLAHLDDGTTVAGHLDVDDLTRQPRERLVVFAIPREHQFLVGVLVVDAQQAVFRIAGTERQRHVTDEVIVVAELAKLRRYAVCGGVEARSARHDAVSPANQHVGTVARRDVVIGIHAVRDPGKAERRFRTAGRGDRGRLDLAHQCQRRQCPDGRDA